MTMSRAAGSRLRAAMVVAVPLLVVGSMAPAQAHHPFGLAEGTQLNGWQGLLSGIGHPLLGPDHLLFLLALAFVGLKRPQAWTVPLLAVGLAGSGLAQVLSLPAAWGPWTEALVALSLALEGLVALSVLPSAWLLPLFGLHGFLLGGMVVGAEPTPLLAYFAGLLLAQGALLLLVTSLSQRLVGWLGSDGRRLAAGIWIGIGGAFAWVALAS